MDKRANLKKKILQKTREVRVPILVLEWKWTFGYITAAF
jgi:hypothetical protein